VPRHPRADDREQQDEAERVGHADPVRDLHRDRDLGERQHDEQERENREHGTSL